MAVMRVKGFTKRFGRWWRSTLAPCPASSGPAGLGVGVGALLRNQWRRS
jgi:hypothetical protein